MDTDIHKKGSVDICGVDRVPISQLTHLKLADAWGTGRSEITLGGMVSAEELWCTARHFSDPDHAVTIKLSPDALDRISRAAAFVGRIVERGVPTYGINTGFGHFADVTIPRHRLAELQTNLVRSHCCGVGDLLPRDVVAAMWLLRLNTIGHGHSGTRIETVRTIIGLLEAGVLACVPSRGSVGASGDLAPSAHATLPLLGEGWCTVPLRGCFGRVQSREVLTQLGIEPIRFAPKEGLSLINGTQLTTALALKGWSEGEKLLRAANMAAAISLEALRGSRQPLDLRVLQAHRHPGTLRCGEEMLHWLEGPSEVHASRTAVSPVQDPYSFRCAPQVHGVVREELDHTRRVLQDEIEGTSDNPLLFPDDEAVVSCGNFHALHPARACDRMAAAFTTLATISERRTNVAMSEARTGLPDFLIDDGGVQSGLMMAHVTAAALTSECRANCFPASVDSIPTNNDQEDHVSMGPAAGLKMLDLVGKLRSVLAIEILTAAQALYLRAPRRPAPRIEAVLRAIREEVAPLQHDRVLADDIERVAQRIDEETYIAYANEPL